MNHRLTVLFYILLFTVGLGAIILAVNEVTLDAYDRLGSNYWLAYFAMFSGIVTFCLALWLIRFRARPKDRFLRSKMLLLFGPMTLHVILSHF